MAKPDLGIIKETQARLFSDLILGPNFQSKVEQKNKERREERTAKIKAKNPQMDQLSMIVAGIYQELNESKLTFKIHSRVVNEILEILMSHLTEKSQREATQKMRELTAEEVFKDF